jgi:hypothetical protein
LQNTPCIRFDGVLIDAEVNAGVSHDPSHTAM